MNLTAERSVGTSEAAVRKLVEIAAGIEPLQGGRKSGTFTQMSKAGSRPDAFAAAGKRLGPLSREKRTPTKRASTAAKGHQKTLIA